MGIKVNKNSKIVSLFIIFLIISSLFSSLSFGLKIESMNEDSENEYDEYIIELKEKPLFKYAKEIRSNLFYKTKLNNYKNELLDSQNDAKKAILSLFDDETGQEVVISSSYYKITNGFCIKNMQKRYVDSIANMPFVKNIYPNYRFSVLLDESVDIINASAVWEEKDSQDRFIKGQGVRIALLDTGANYSHPDLVSSYVDGYDYFNNDDDPMDDDRDGHGTHCAGILVGDGTNSSGRYTGVAPEADLYVYKVLDNKGDGEWENILLGLEAAVDPNGDGDTSDHVDIISASFGTETPGSPDDFVCKKIDEIVDLGIIVVTAAGNMGSGQSTIISPGASLKAITVGSVDKNDVIAVTSSRGPVFSEGREFIKPDVVAPGVSIMSTSSTGGYKTLSGTSMSAPHVAGAVALLLQANPDWTPSMVKNALERSAVDLGTIGKDNSYGSGRIDVFNALKNPIPYAILNVPNRILKGIIDIKGTAKSGNEDPDDFINYSLSYRKGENRVQIYLGDSQVDNDILCQWNTSNLEEGIYELTLKVVCKDHINNSKTIETSEVKNVEIVNEEEKIFIDAPSAIDESTVFNIKITDFSGEPVPAFVILTAPFSLPRIKFGSVVEIKSPRIFSPRKENITGKIIVIEILSQEIIKQDITIIND